MMRQRQRDLDLNESYYLLLELCCTEPLIQQCFNMIENICLAHGVTIAGKKPTSNFQKHIDLYYVPFLSASIRAMHTYGFVPWRIMKLPSGDKIPEVLPMGSFRWTIEHQTNQVRNTGIYRSGCEDSLYVYSISLNPNTKIIEDLYITEWHPPNANVTENSVMYATVPSPMSYVIQSYKNLQAAAQRQAHADAWNCTARVIVSNEPKEFAHDQHRRELFGTFNQHIDVYGKLHAVQPKTSSDKIDDMFFNRSFNHHPSVYSLPSHHHIDSAPVLQPCADLCFLQNKYKMDVCSLMGIPAELISNAQYKDSSEKGNRQQGRNTSTTRLMQAKMQTICTFLKTLLSEVYSKIYKQEHQEFELIPMPRLEIACIEDLQILHEIGVLQPEHTVDLAGILLGKLKKAKVIPNGPFDPASETSNSEKKENSDKESKDKEKPNKIPK
jgi:hypothetical protein